MSEFEFDLHPEDVSVHAAEGSGSDEVSEDYAWTEEDVAAFFEAPLADPVGKVEQGATLSTIATGESHPTESGYAEGTYPQAQALGHQFDKPEKPFSQVASGKSEEQKQPKSVEVDAPGAPADVVGKVEGDDSEAAKARDAAEGDVQNVKLGNAAKNPETA